jgi:uncharacterized membrane protein (UPF0127 family)
MSLILNLRNTLQTPLWMRLSVLTVLSALHFQTHAQVQGQPQTQLPRLQLSAGMHLIEVQVASTFEQRGTGLMFRTDMPQHEGMLFVFEQPSQQCFWMKNTLLPLSAAFIADNGRIVNIVDMKPQTLDSHCSTEPVRFVLEMNQGWFAKKGLKAGSVIKGVLFKN